MTWAYNLAPAAPLSLMGYLQVVFAGALAWVFLADRPDPLSLLGSALVIGAGAGTAWLRREG